MCTPAAFGLAMALPRRKVLALDSDGNLILNLGVLGTIANENPTNLTVLVMDNGNYLGSHKKEPGMRTATGGKMKLQEVAKGCGIDERALDSGRRDVSRENSDGAQKRRAAFYLRTSRSARS
jgi:thiamine pyrophosphate-dependent acetolactate synthase large subunit-like protein